MSFVVGAVPGLVAALVVLAMLHGYRLLRSDQAEGLDLDDLILLKGRERTRARGTPGCTNTKSRTNSASVWLMKTRLA